MPQRQTSSSRTVSSSYSTTSSQSQLPPPDATQVFNKTEYRIDEFKGTKKLVGPMINREGTDWQVEGECGSALRGWLLNDGSWDFQLYAERYANEPAHFTEAIDEAGCRFAVTQIDSKTNSYYKNGVLVCTETIEVFGVPLSLAYLRDHENTGIRLKFYGNGPSGSMYVPPYYIKGFFAKMDQFAPAPVITRTTTVQQTATPVYSIVPAPANCPPEYYSQPVPTSNVSTYRNSVSQSPADSSYYYVEKPAESYTIQRTVDRYSLDKETERGLPATLSPSVSGSSAASSSSSYNYQENVTPMVAP
ncbi:MAG: hypothetical protein V1746_04485 [bacterium]